jgi:hypothetical protein
VIVGIGVFAGACSSSNNPTNPGFTNNSTTNVVNSSTTGVGNTTTAGNTGGGGTTTTGATGTNTGAGTTTTAGDAGGGGGDGGICPSTLQDKITTCTPGVDPTCIKGCGPDLPTGSPPPANLGTKQCLCQTGVYQCQACVYESPLPTCYQPSATPPACAAGTVNKGTCTTPCTTGTGNDVCTMTSDAGKAQGCVCVQASAGPVWTCATQWW